MVSRADSRRGARRSGGRVGLLVGVAVAIALVPLLRSPLFQQLEQKTVDARLRVAGRTDAEPRIVVAAIDAEAVDRLGQWPWPRSVLADLVRALDRAGARAIAFDVVFSEPSRCDAGGDDALAAAIRDAGSVVLGYYFTADGNGAPGGAPPAVERALIPPGGLPEIPEYRGIETNLPVLAAAASSEGHFVVRPDSDGTVRHYSLLLRWKGDVYPALALRAVQVFEGRPPIVVGDRGGVPDVRIGERAIPVSEKGEAAIRWRGRFGEAFPYVSVAEVLDGTIAEGAVRDRIVFVGATEPGLGDVRTTPFDTAAPGVEVHATVADNLLRGSLLRGGAVETLAGVAAMLLLGVTGGLAGAASSRPAAGAVVAALAIAVWMAAGTWAVVEASRRLPVFLPVASGALAYTTGAVWRTVFAEARSRRIRGAFGKFVSESIVREMLDHPDRLRLGGERREVTVLFADLRGFTARSESMEPEAVAALLNRWLTPVTRVILDNGGTIDKYMGDAVMAFFGAPVADGDHAARACRAALGVRDLAARSADGLAVGIGINTGVAAVGNMGSDRIFDYTVVGDTVNLAARLEGQTRELGVDILVGGATAAAARDRFEFREMGRIRVKGKERDVEVFELRGHSALT